MYAVALLLDTTAESEVSDFERFAPIGEDYGENYRANRGLTPNK
jgi:hypothetical protein